MMHTEFVVFRLLHMPCCGQQVCWINPRWPNYCPECGALIYPKIKQDSNLLLVQDSEAQLKVRG